MNFDSGNYHETNLNERFAALVHKMDPQCTLVRTWTLRGGVSAHVTALEAATPDGQTRRMIVRQHGSADLQRNPRIAADEFKLLQILKSEGLPTPTPYYLDESNEVFSTPYIVIEFIAGETVLEPSDIDHFAAQLAATLARIHNVDVSKHNFGFLPNYDAFDEFPMVPELKSAQRPPSRNQRVLLHGDFWPGNVLWNDGRIAAVIDWEDTALGDPLVDIANTRLELLWLCGLHGMNTFTDEYQLVNPIDFTNLPYWDFVIATRKLSNISQWGLERELEKSMRDRAGWFIKQALEKLGV